MKNIIYLTTLVFLFSSCSDTDIPTTSTDSKQVDWSALKQTSNIESKSSENEVFEETKSRDEKVSSTNPTVDAIPNFEENENEEYSKENSDNFSEKNEDDSEIIDEVVEQKIDNIDLENVVEQQQENQFLDYEKELGKQMESALANYPHPPTPANLSPYDSRESSSYREPTKQEVTSGSGDFPPMPPAMLLSK